MRHAAADELDLPFVKFNSARASDFNLCTAVVHVVVVDVIGGRRAVSVLSRPIARDSGVRANL